MDNGFAGFSSMQEYLKSRLDSIFHGHAATPVAPTAGSNNAGYVKPTQTPDVAPPWAGGPRPNSHSGADVPRFGGSFGTMNNFPYMTGGGSINNPNYDAMDSGGVLHNDWSMTSNPAPQRPTFGGIPSFAAGGMMSPQGTAVRPGMPMQGAPEADEPQIGAVGANAMNGAQIDQEAQRFVQANPQVVQQISAVIQHAMQTGQLTYQELNTAVQLARAALANPASYPQIRQFAIKNGLGTEADLPQTMDRGLLFTLLISGKALQSAGGSAPAQGNAAPPTGQGKAGLLPEYSDGGMTGDKKHLAVMHPEEYVMPRDVVLYHGKKHMDKLVEQARTPKDEQPGS